MKMLYNFAASGSRCWGGKGFQSMSGRASRRSDAQVTGRVTAIEGELVAAGAG